jgi:2-octaprenyl-6-methoxyphenol hydroxylase
MLDAYARARRPDMVMRLAGIDALNRASQAEAPLLRKLRGAGVRVLHDLAPLRRALMHLGLGAAPGRKTGD